MRLLLAFISILLFNSCESKKILSYEQGLEDCQRIYKEQTKNNPSGIMRNRVQCLIGAQIPDFHTKTLDGDDISRESLIGKVSILNFWFIGCHPCVAEIPGLNKIVEKYGTEKANYIAIGRDKGPQVERFLQKHPWKFEQIADANDLIEDTFEYRWGFPTTFILNKDAEIVYSFSGGRTDSLAIQAVQDHIVPHLEQELNNVTH